MDINQPPFNKLKPIPFNEVRITDNFWANRQKTNREISIFHQYEQLEKDNHIDNFRVAAGIQKGTHLGEFYYDSDLYKWLEAACYILHLHNDKTLKETVDKIISLIQRAQIEDGYVNTFYSVKFIQRRFSNLLFMHELYCAGHLIQAAMAHYKATGSNSLLEIANKFANLIVKLFLEENREEAPGHQEIELALMELYHNTNNRKFYELAEDFVNRRGKSSNSIVYIIKKFLNLSSTLNEAKEINQKFTNGPFSNNGLKNVEHDEIKDFYSNLSFSERIKFYLAILNGKCYQINKPVREIKEPVGHAVRAMYMYCGMADIYSVSGDAKLLQALERCWLDMVNAKMYITGGIGSIKGIEGFEKDFKLKKEKSYSETCAAIGNMMWNWRMLHITGDCKYADLIERLMYNAMLVGQSIDGKGYFYSNPLLSNGEHLRAEWFLCPCCPPNIARTIASMGKYIYSISQRGVWIHQYIGSEVNIELENRLIKLVQESKFPWQGKVTIKVCLEQNYKFSIFLRIPEWTKNPKLSINGLKYREDLSTGKYTEIIRNWMDGDQIELDFGMKPEFIQNSPKRRDTMGYVAIKNGPLIYCLEQKDNQEFDMLNVVIE
ncbi:MAG: glycoside hydrolase family 127 protein, partial [Candidatus Thorarchaeota archaeon]